MKLKIGMPFGVLETILQNGEWHPFSSRRKNSVNVFGECAVISELEKGRKIEKTSGKHF